MVFVGEFKKNVTRQTWRDLFHLGECLKKMVSHTDLITFLYIDGDIKIS